MTSPVLSIDVPFTEESQLYRDFHTASISSALTLPGQPRICLKDSLRLRRYLRKELWAGDLERMASRLWMMSTQSSANISPLHQQKVKGRAIVVTEDPRLHLVWIYDRVFIKPLPSYLLSYQFWKQYILPEKFPIHGRDEDERRDCSQIRKSALGFLRTYYYLIQYESDFDIACNKDTRLLPLGISWVEFCNFSSTFQDIENDLVSERYHYGELRLTRLNLYAKIWLGKFYYERVHGQYGTFFARFYGPLLFMFGILSIILSAMQVELSAETLMTNLRWQSFWFACRWFAVIILACMTLLTVVLVCLLVGMVVDEWIFALRARYEKKKSRTLKSPKV